MKILLAVHNYPPEFRGGVERIVEMSAADLKSLGHEVTVVSGSAYFAPTAQLVRETHEGVEVRRIVRESGFLNLADEFDPNSDALYEQVLDECRPDIVHVHHWANLGAQSVALAERRGIPAVATLHDYYASCSLFFRVPANEGFCDKAEGIDNCVPCIRREHLIDVGELEHGVDARLATFAQELALARRILFASPAQRRAFLDLPRAAPIAESKTTVVPFGLPNLGAIASRRAADGRIVCAHWGNISKVKGLIALAEAAARLDRPERLKLLILGRVVEPGIDEEIRRKAGAVTVEFGGAFEASELSRLLAEADFAAFPSLAFETHSLVVDEALALGLPVVVADRGAPRDRIGEAGIVAKAGDADDLARALEAMLDPAERARRSAAARAAQRRSSRDYAADSVRVYAEAIAAPGAAPGSISDHSRMRLAFRRRRLGEIHRYVLGLEGARADLERAVAGDREALERVRLRAPATATSIEGLLKSRRDP